MNDNKKNIHQRLQIILLSGIAVSLFLSIKLNSILIVLAVINWLLSGDIKSNLKNILQNKISIMAIVLFAVHLLSWFLSSNQAEAGAFLERKLSLLVFPILFSDVNVNQKYRTVFIAFLLALVVAMIYCLSMAFYNFSNTHLIEVFYYHSLASAIQFNAIYLSAYLVFGIQICFYAYFIERIGFKILLAGLIIFFVICLILLSSKMMLFALLVSLIAWSYYLIKHKGRFIFISSIITAILVCIIFLSPATRKRFELEWNMNTQILNMQHYTYNTPFTGSSLRLVIWRFCFDILNQKQAWILGIGTGDMQTLLNQKYRESGMYTGNKQLNDTGYLGYGPHNQYIETLLSTGLLGLSILLVFLILLIKEAIQQKNILLIQLTIVATLFFTTESALGSNKGIVFFMLFFMLLKHFNTKL